MRLQVISRCLGNAERSKEVVDMRKTRVKIESVQLEKLTILKTCSQSSRVLKRGSSKQTLNRLFVRVYGIGDEH